MLELGEPVHRMCRALAAHLAGRLQAGAEGGAAGVAEDATAHVGIELDAGNAGRLAGWYIKGNQLLFPYS